MNKIDKKDLLKVLKEMKSNQTIFVAIDKDISNVMKILDIKIQSYMNLFISYANSNNQTPNKLNLDKFLEKYSDKYTESIILRDEVLKESLGKAYEYFMSNSFRYNFDYNLDILRLTKVGDDN